MKELLVKVYGITMGLSLLMLLFVSCVLFAGNVSSAVGQGILTVVLFALMGVFSICPSLIMGAAQTKA